MRIENNISRVGVAMLLIAKCQRHRGARVATGMLVRSRKSVYIGSSRRGFPPAKGLYMERVVLGEGKTLCVCRTTRP